MILVSLVLVLGFLAAPKARANTYACDDGSGMGCYSDDLTDSFSSTTDFGSTVVFIRCRATYGQPWTYCYGYNFECDEYDHCVPICARSIVSVGNCTCSVKGGTAYQFGSCAFS